MKAMKKKQSSPSTGCFNRTFLLSKGFACGALSSAIPFCATLWERRCFFLLFFLAIMVRPLTVKGWWVLSDAQTEKPYKANLVLLKHGHVRRLRQLNFFSLLERKREKRKEGTKKRQKKIEKKKRKEQKDDKNVQEFPVVSNQPTQKKLKYWRRGSNSQPSDPKSDALPLSHAS